MDRYHLLKNPAVGGTPTIAIAPTVKAAAVMGRRRPSPASAGTSDTPVCKRMAMTARNSVPFISAWFMMCSSAATYPNGVASPMPMAMKASWLTDE